MRVFGSLFVLLLAGLATCVSGYKILGIFPFAARSHYIVGSSLMKELARKGHDITVISPFQEKTPIQNFKTIHTPAVAKFQEKLTAGILNYRNKGIVESIMEFYEMGVNVTKLTFEEKEVQKFIKSNQKFDLVIMEVFLNEAMLGFAHLFKAPVIGISTFGASIWTTDMVGSPTPPSYVPNPFLGFSDHMTFTQRVGNILMAHFERIYTNYFYLHHHADIYDRVFPNPKPDFYDVRRNVSLVLLNTHVTLSFPRPYVSNMIEVGGMQVNRKTKELPAKMKEFIESAGYGVIYFSMGSNLKSTTLPVEKRDAILKAFKSLKQKVLWKWEDTNLPGKPDNVFISDWFPQDDVLAHPNVKAFITHGGLLSTTESIYHGKPVIGIPMFGDQFLNMARAVNGGYGILADYNELTTEHLLERINEMMSNDKYSKKAHAMSQRYRDQPLEPMETAVYWVEYVIRHKGAPHLKNGGMDLSFIEYHNIDAFALIYGGLLFVVYVLYLIVRKVVCSLCAGKCSSKGGKTRKPKKSHNE